MSSAHLLTYLFDGQPHPLTDTFTLWLASKRFRAFADSYKDKIRKKIRGTRDADTIRDLYFELETAYCLAQEKRFSVVYEHYGADKSRGPDFTVTFGSLTFNVEVTRLRPSDRDDPSPGHETARLVDTIAFKLRQLPPGTANLLVIFADNTLLQTIDLPQAIHHFKILLEQRDPAILARHRFLDPSDFFKYYLRLSAILLRGSCETDAARPLTYWPNPQAKHPLPSTVRTILTSWNL
jgi:hypothetical protein